MGVTELKTWLIQCDVYGCRNQAIVSDTLFAPLPAGWTRRPDTSGIFREAVLCAVCHDAMRRPTLDDFLNGTVMVHDAPGQ